MSEPDRIDCEEAVRRLGRYLDGELEQADRERMERHLETCRSCWSRAEFEQRLRAEIAALGQREVPPVFERRIRDLLERFGKAS